KLESRLRRQADRRRIHHGKHAPMSLAQAAAQPPVEPSNGVVTLDEEEPLVRHVGPLEVMGDGPLVMREKTFKTDPMTLAQAMYEMELVGHDFFLFVDRDTSAPSVVYRRRGYDYGVIRLEH
ncbi:MAG: sigma 54 modulation/S30EA ribosomal C-terminal domain-containing protein, partial [Nocardioidaceae bacterium]|nr:sigma 54 modulation/S30EA ribosomal C-terminal domain-containing protein [Nocardioidaceae bacterium]